MNMRKWKEGIREDYPNRSAIWIFLPFIDLVNESTRNPIWIRNLQSTLKRYTLYFLGFVFPS